MTETRNRLSKYDTLDEGITTMEGRRETLERWRYYQQAEQMNFLIGLGYLFKIMQRREAEAEEAEEAEE